MRHQGKVAIVTASSTGIGKAIATRLASEGCSVVVSSRNAEHVEHAVKEISGAAKGSAKIIGCVCHAGKTEDRKKLVQTALDSFGRLDYVVPNAAVSTHVGDILGITEKQYDIMFNVNLRSVFFLVQEAAPHIADGGAILLVSSIGGYEPVGYPIGMYSVTKTALLGLTQALATSFATDPRKIRVNCVAPGLIRTPFASHLTDGPMADEFISRIPLGRVGESSEIGAVAAFLLSSDASFVTGETLVAAGGQRSRL